MLIDIKIKIICCGIMSQWPFENLRRPWYFSLFLQNGLIYLAEMLY